MFIDSFGEYFIDWEFHTYLESGAKIEREPRIEWFKVDRQASQNYFNRFSGHRSIERSDGK
ncbi:MAG: hypothetical protein K2K96_05630 [Lachnospiraceae bacterium]|nr:hypothetical protein [Lachnospiraceae bacterium]